MLLQAHSFIVFLHPNAAMQRQLIDLNPFHETECQTAVVREQAREYFCFCHHRFIHEECVGSGLLILKRLSECDDEKSKSNFMIWEPQPPRQCHLTSLAGIQSKTRRPDQLQYLTKHLTQTCPRCYCMRAVWPCVVVYPAVLAGSGSAAADGIVLTVRQSVQTKLNQDNFLLISEDEGGLDLTVLSQIKKGDPDRLLKAPHYVLLWA